MNFMIEVAIVIGLYIHMMKRRIPFYFDNIGYGTILSTLVIDGVLGVDVADTN